jgi:DNA modification methylase
MSETLTILTGDALAMLRTLEDESVNCCVTSPPYWGLRDYGVEGQIGLERTPEEFIAKLVEVFAEVRRVLRKDGTCWVNMGDCYATGACSVADCPGGGKQGENWKGMNTSPNRMPLPGLKAKDLVGQPWMLAFALRADGWYLRRDIIWHKPNSMPESCTDRPPTAHEYVFLLSKSERYYYDEDAIAEPVSGMAHSRGNGVNPKCSGWAEGPGSHKAIDHAKPGGSYKGSVPGRKDGPGQDRRSKGERRNAFFLDSEIPIKLPHDSIESRKARAREGTMSFPTEAKNGIRAASPKQNASFSGAVTGLVEVRKKRSVWSIPTVGFSEAHFATYPPDLVKPCILAGCPPGGIVLDPFAGSGTSGAVALELGRKAVMIEMNPDYVQMIKQRCNITPGFAL